jgi:hypothetical protein
MAHEGGPGEVPLRLRRILIHGEDQRSRLLTNDAVYKESQELHAQNQEKLIRSVGKYTAARLIFSIINALLVATILWRMFYEPG